MGIKRRCFLSVHIALVAILVVGSVQAFAQDATPVSLADDECVISDVAATPEPVATMATPEAPVQFVGIFEEAPPEGSSAGIEGHREVEALVAEVYACVTAGDDAAVRSYFTARALEAMQEEMTPSSLLDRFGPRESAELIELTRLDDGRLVVDLAFVNPIGTYVESWVLVPSDDSLLIDGIRIPPPVEATPAA